MGSITGTTSGYSFTPALKVYGAATMIVNYVQETTYSYVYLPQTIIYKDGLISMQSDKYFMIDNSGDSQKIYAKSLSTTKGIAGSGDLYVSQSFIDAFKALCDELNEFFPSVRSIGDNATNADNCITKIKAVNIKCCKGTAFFSYMQISIV
ncbi:MAG: hypothetical protein ACI4BD_06840 [Paludibacteraceae bacterium]